MFNPANKPIFSIDVEGIENTGLQVLSFDGVEGLNAEYVFEVTLVNSRLRFDITKLLSKSVYLSFTPDKKTGVHGVIQSVRRGAVGTQYAQYKIIITPRFTHLHKRVNQRAFVAKTATQIISQILLEYGMQPSIGFEFRLKESCLKREFCTQYGESDAEFIYRLCEEEGLAVHYEFEANNHKKVFTSSQPFFPSLLKAIRYVSDTGAVADTQVFRRFDVNLSSHATAVTQRNYNFQSMKTPDGAAQKTAANKANDAVELSLEHYNYPNRHTNKTQGDELAKLEMERLRANHLLAEAYSDVPELHAGFYFSITEHAALDSSEPWLVKQIRHQGRQPQVLEAFGEDISADTSTSSCQLTRYFRQEIEPQLPSEQFQQGYRNSLVATPQEVVYRPQNLHFKPKILGTQTAIVVGAVNEEIYCDEYGRIKVQFHWDREGQFNEHSSHWIRVASSWAHDGYGAVLIPRVGMEVMISFLEGDPDNPIVTGCLHNGINKHPYDLPANKTVSSFKTSSSKGGVGSNELRIEDKAGNEQIFVQAQKDFDQLTKNNHTLEVKNNSHLQVEKEHSETVKGNRYICNEQEEHHLTQQDRKTQVLMNDYKTVAMSEHSTIGTIKTTEAGMEIHLKSGMQTTIDGGMSLTLKAGGQHIILNPAGIFMSTPVFTGGSAMKGTPASPITPIAKNKFVEATSARPVSVVNNFERASVIGALTIPICGKQSNGACTKGDACQCKESA